MEIDLSELIQKAQQGDKESYGKIYKIFYQRIFRFCYVNLNNKELAQDFCQETFLKAWKSIASYKDKVGGSFQAFLFRIARNLIIDYSRKKKETRLAEFEEIEKEENFEREIDRTDEAREIRMALEDLPELEKQIVILRYFEELSTAETAKALNMNEGALRVRIHRVLKKLKQNMERK